MYPFDHIVHFVDDPKKMVKQTKSLGLHTVEGGRHEMWGTYNSLCYFGLSYIEFIGVFDELLLEQSAKVPYTLHETYFKRNKQKGFTRLALRTTTIEQDVEKFRKAGLNVFGPDSFSRVRPDGSTLNWKLLHFGKEKLALDYPFLIQWEDSDEDRWDDLWRNGTIKNHPLGKLAFKEIVLFVEDLQIAKEWAQLFQFTIHYKNNHFVQLLSPNCLYTFVKTKDKNEIGEIILSGAKNEQSIIIEKGKYTFLCQNE